MDRVTFDFKLHDRYQVQVKFNFPLRKEQARQRVRLETYLFLPGNLDINSDTYGRDTFYRDFTSLTRYEVPVLTLEQILDPHEAFSPLFRLKKILDELRVTKMPHAFDAQTRWVYELRVLGCIVRERIHEHVRSMGERFEAPFGHAAWNREWLAENFSAIESHLKHVEAIENEVRTLKREYLAFAREKHDVEAIGFLDEALSIELQRACARVSMFITRAQQLGAPLSGSGVSGAGGDPDAAALLKRLGEAYRSEESYRAECGYPSSLESDRGPLEQRTNEHLIYRQGMLKKYCQDVLQLSAFVQQGSKSLQTLLNALAAMLAMAVFLVVVYFVQHKLPADSILYIALPVFAYAIKDRVKETLKLVFAKRATGILRDREAELIDRGTVPLTVGRAFEVFGFAAEKYLPEDIRKARARGSMADFIDSGRPEQILRHEKEMAVRVDRVFQRHQRVNRICEIYRLSLRHMLFRMDEPYEKIDVLKTDVESGETRPDTMDALKVYHANLVLKVSAQDELGQWTSQLRKYRLVLSRDGIARFETSEQTMMPVKISGTAREHTS